MTLRDDMEAEDLRFREELKRECESAENIEAVILKISEASKERQREIFRMHQWGEPVILPFPSNDSPRAA